MLLGLGDDPFKSLDRFSFETAALVVGVLDLSPIDQGVQADLDVVPDFLDRGGSLPGLLRKPGAECLRKQELFNPDAVWLGQYPQAGPAWPPSGRG